MAREHREIIHAEEVDLAELPAQGWPPGASARILSADPETGALTARLELPPGYRRGAGFLTAAVEVYLLSGTLRIGDAVRGPGHYEFTPAGVAQQRWAVQERCELVLMAKARPDFVPGEAPGASAERIALDTERIPWARGRVPGPPPGLFSKTLRHDPTTGERTFLCGCVRRYEYPLIEYHDCSEEAYQVAGDMRIATSGLMRPGSYFWRPPYFSHGPFYSRGGMIALMTVDGPLVNHYVDDPRRTPEENRAEALAQGAPRDHFAEAR
jgi:hypothetical protein